MHKPRQEARRTRLVADPEARESQHRTGRQHGSELARVGFHGDSIPRTRSASSRVENGFVM